MTYQKNKQKTYNIFVITTISSLLFLEVFSGVSRYVLSSVGLSVLLYLPKIATLFLVILKIVKSKLNAASLLCGFLFILSCFIGWLYGANIKNQLFSSLMYAPLLLGYFWGENLDSYKKWFLFLFWFFIIGSFIGLLLDFATNIPWKGLEYEFAGQNIEGNKEWDAGGFDRLAGFARTSAALAIILSCLSFFLIGKIKNKLYAIILFVLTLSGILLTTSKGVFLAFLLAGLYLIFIRKPSLKKTIHIIIISIGIILPTLSIFFEYNISNSITDPDEVILLASFDDRLVNTWPSIFNKINKEKAFLLGTGFGTVGTSAKLFPINGIGDILAITDSTSLYLYAMFGIIGIIIYCSQLYLLNDFSKWKMKESRALQALVICVVINGWTTDICESATAIFFIGYILHKSNLLSTNKEDNPPPQKYS